MSHELDPSERVGTDHPLFVASLEKGFQVLETLAAAQRPLSLAEIARLSGIGRSAAQRFAYTLRTLGYVDQYPDNKRYVLSTKMISFGQAYASSDAVQRLAEPILQQLHEDCGETVNLTVLDGHDVVYVLRYLSQHVVSVNLQVGARLPAYCTAPGRAILAHLSEVQAAQLLRSSDRVKHTDKTETDFDRLMQRLREVRDRGYSLNDQETFAGDISVAAAIVDRLGRPVAAVNVAVPSPRWSVKSLEAEWASAVVTAASRISAALGYGHR